MKSLKNTFVFAFSGKEKYLKAQVENGNLDNENFFSAAKCIRLVNIVFAVILSIKFTDAFNEISQVEDWLSSKSATIKALLIAIVYLAGAYIIGSLFSWLVIHVISLYKGRLMKYKTYNIIGGILIAVLVLDFIMSIVFSIFEAPVLSDLIKNSSVRTCVLAVILGLTFFIQAFSEPKPQKKPKSQVLSECKEECEEKS